MQSILKKIKLPANIRLNNLSRREKYTVFGAACLICLFVLVQFIISPLLNNKAQLQKSLKGKMTTIQKMQQLQADLRGANIGGSPGSQETSRSMFFSSERARIMSHCALTTVSMEATVAVTRGDRERFRVAGLLRA